MTGDDREICFACIGDALAQFRIEAAPRFDGAIARFDAPIVDVDLAMLRTQPPHGYDRQLDLPRLLPRGVHWCALFHDPEWGAPAWREWMRADINLWLLEREHREAITRANTSYGPDQGAWILRMRALEPAIEAERTIQRVLCELEVERARAA